MSLKLVGEVHPLTPSYELPPDCEDTEILRVVIRESMSGEFLRRLIEDIVHVTESLVKDGGPSISMVKAAAANKALRHKKSKFKKTHDGNSHVC
jgi:glutamate decarboxylase